MTLKPRWRRLLLFLVVGIGLFLGAGATLPLWTVDVPISYGRIPPESHGPLWEAVAWMARRPFAWPEADWGNFTLTVLFIFLGSFAGFMAFWAWEVWRDRGPSGRVPTMP